MSGTPVTCVAVDLGASSGRVLLGTVGGDELTTREVARFDNGPVRLPDGLHWDVLGLFRSMLAGLAEAAREVDELASVGIDGWGVDYALLDASGALLGNPYHYRDGRTDGVLERVLDTLGRDRLYRTTGSQFLPINTLVQVVSAIGSPQLAAANTLLMLPDLLAYWLTGNIGVEITNASSTQMLDVHRRCWARELVADAGIDPGLLPELREPGRHIGPVRPELAEEFALPAGLPVVAVGSHDTASAVAGVPAAERDFAYISCGTWALVGLELDSPVTGSAAMVANFTNELGVDGTTRFLRNVMGLWLLDESLRWWRSRGLRVGVAEVLADAARQTPFRCLVNPDDPVFLPPGDIPRRIAAVCRESGQPAPESPGELARCVVDSLALAFRRTVRKSAELAGRDPRVVHVVGGGARNELLCQLTSDACGLPVIAGPVEATSVGNLLVQARTTGRTGLGDLVSLRRLIAHSHHLRRYRPAAAADAWAAAQRRVAGS